MLQDPVIHFPITLNLLHSTSKLLTRRTWRTWLVVAMLAFCCAASPGQDGESAAGLRAKIRNRHAWGRFSPGAWKRVRVFKETVDDDGKPSTSVEEATTRLIQADDLGFHLEIAREQQTTGDTAPPLQKASFTYLGLPSTLQAAIKAMPNDEIVVEGKKVAVEGMVAEFISTSRRGELKFYWSANGVLMRQESQTKDLKSGDTVVQLASQVELANVLHAFNNKYFEARLVRTVVQGVDEVRTTFEVHCNQVPGGIVRSWTKVVDADGQLKEREMLEMLDFGLRSE